MLKRLLTAHESPETVDEIAEAVERAMVEFEFFRRSKGRLIVRREDPDAKVHRLIDGEWVEWRFRRSLFRRSLNGPAWVKMTGEQLRIHARKYLISGLTRESLTYTSNPVGRLRRSAFGCWLLPPLKGGACRRGFLDAVDDARPSYTQLLGASGGGDLEVIKEQALHGYEHARNRAANTEQRANYFLGAAGLTTSLVLANAGLLLGTGTTRLSGTNLDLATIALGVASVAALIVGGRAMQGAIVTFGRVPPNSVSRLLARRGHDGDALLRAYIADLLVALNRTTVIADWKVARVAGARRWFVVVILGVVALTAIVLIEAVAG